MPEVGGKKFAYTPEGISEAREEASRTGIPMKVKQRYSIGGLINLTAADRVKTRGGGKELKAPTHRVR